MKIIENVKHLRHEVYIWKFCLEPIKKNKIIMWANSFKHYGCSPKYITEFLLKNYPKQFDIVWVFEQGRELPEDIPEEVRIVRYFSIEYLHEIHTAKFIICNMRTGVAHLWHKRTEQIYIQTWHSSLRLKKIEGDAENLPFEYVKNAQLDSNKIDILLSGCKFSTEIFKRAFWYNGEIMESGTPRCDILLNNNEKYRRKVFHSYKLANEQKLVLYAPTFRSNKPSDFLGMDFERLRETLGNEWIIGARLHPNVRASVIPKGAISMSKYSDMQELLAAADILITDFSSCMFDMAIAGKICILYVPDLEEYLKKERGLYFNIQKLPFPLVRNMDELCQIISSLDYNDYQCKLQQFMKQIGSYEDGHATERVCQYIYQNMK